MSEKRFTVESTMVRECILDNASGEQLDTFDYTERLCDLLNEQQATIEMQELRLQQLEEILELSKNLNKKYREKLIDMNLKMMIDDE